MAVEIDMRPLTIEDIWRLATVSETVMSPDGNWVAYLASTYDRAADEEKTQIHLASFDGQSDERLGTTELRPSSPQWTPDGSELVVISNGDLYAISVGGTGVERLTRDAGAEGFTIGPGGRQLCFVAKDPSPGRAPGAPVVLDTLVHKTRADGWFDGRYRHLWLLDRETGSATRLTSGDGHDYDPAFDPRGERLAFSSNSGSSPESDRPLDVWILDLADRGLRRITSADGEFGQPTFSPDGQRIAFLGHRGALGDEASNRHIWVALAAGDAAADVLEGWDHPAEDVILTETRPHPPLNPPVWSSDGTELYFVGTVRGVSTLFAVSSVGGEPRVLIDGDHEVSQVSFDRSRSRLAAIISTPTDPPEVFVGHVGAPVRALTDANAEILEGVFRSPQERVTFDAPDGWEIEGFLLKPPGFDSTREYPLVVRIAGGPHLAYGSSFVDEVQVLTGRGYVVFFCNPRGTHSYGHRHTSAVVGDWCGRDADDILAGVDHVESLGFVDPSRIGVTGASYGGLMVNWLVGHTDRFACAVSQRSISNLYSFYGSADRQNGSFELELGGMTPYDDPDAYVKRSPITFVKNVRTPLLLIQAGDDYITPVTQAEEFYVALKRLGRQVRLVVYPDQQHYVRRYGRPSSRIHYTETHLGWFDRFLRGSADAHG